MVAWVAAQLSRCMPATAEPSPLDLISSKFVRPQTLGAIRAVFFVWHFALLLSLFILPNSNALPQMCYLTFWSYTLMICYCLLGAIQFTRHRSLLNVADQSRVMSTLPEDGVYGADVAFATANTIPLDFLDRLHWYVFQVCSSVAPIVTLVYWTVIYPHKHSTRVWADMHVHALNSFVMFTDLFLNTIEFAPRKFYLLLAYTGTYGVFSVWVHSNYGIWPYSFQDPQQNSNVTLTYFGLSLVMFVAWGGMILMTKARNAIANRFTDGAHVQETSYYSHL